MYFGLQGIDSKASVLSTITHHPLRQTAATKRQMRLVRAQHRGGPKSRGATGLNLAMKQDGGGEECVDIKMTEPGKGLTSHLSPGADGESSKDSPGSTPCLEAGSGAGETPILSCPNPSVSGQSSRLVVLCFVLLVLTDL